MLAIDAYEQRERAAYWRAGLVASSVVNAHLGKGQKAAKPEDFIPRARRRRSQTAEQMAAALRAITVALGGEVITSGR